MGPIILNHTRSPLFDHGNFSLQRTWVTLCLSSQTHVLSSSYSTGTRCPDFTHNSTIAGLRQCLVVEEVIGWLRPAAGGYIIIHSQVPSSRL
jgi:hypothetical protein